jgi:hypothetical protein
MTRSRTANTPMAHIALALTAMFLAVTTLEGQRMDIARNGTRQSTACDAKDFTGQVFVEPLFLTTPHTRASGGQVTFTPGARSAWHTHPTGQTVDSHGWNRVGPGVGRPEARDQGRRCHLDATGCQTLARRDSDHDDDPHRDSRDR